MGEFAVNSSGGPPIPVLPVAGGFAFISTEAIIIRKARKGKAVPDADWRKSLGIQAQRARLCNGPRGVCHLTVVTVVVISRET